VLKALALIRLERLAEAMEIIDALDVAGVKHDDLTLQAFVHCYRDSNQTARIVTLYERAIIVDPSEHNLTMLFMAYTRERMYKEQQKIGLRLFKDVGNVPYYLWSVMSLVMQANENPELGKKMLLPLAEKMFKTQIEKTGYTEGSAAEYELQLLILEGQEKWAECAEFMEKPHATKLPLAPYNLVEKGIEYLTRNEQWEKVDEVGTNALADM
uniref:N-terminal acetyltransferase B complex subunit NAA25 homolog n=1 Tax=Caenorhabditis japonica TaxID=281687 RepID=A0A8R1EDX7_CAEJA